MVFLAAFAGVGWSEYFGSGAAPAKLLAKIAIPAIHKGRFKHGISLFVGLISLTDFITVFLSRKNKNQQE